MEFFTASTINGLIHGLLLFAVSSGLTLIFGMMGIINFAHASFYMLGAYLAYTLSSILGFWGAIVIAPFAVKMVYGGNAVTFRPPPELTFSAFSVFGANFPFYRIFVGLVGLLMFGILFYVLRRTRIGIVVRAAVQRPDMVRALGHNVPAVFMGVFGLGAWMAGLAGAVGGALLTTNPNMALELGIIVFVVVVIGGLGSLEGAFIASLLIGLLSSFSVGLDFSLADVAGLVGLRDHASAIGGLLTTRLSTFSSAMPVVLMLIVLALRPAGLFGDRN